MALQEKREHEFTVKRRKEMSVTGVKDINNFDENGVVLETTDGTLVVEGESMKIGELDTERGVVTVSGKVNALYYSSDEKGEKKGIFSRFFK